MADGASLARSWADHLRGGGTTPWPAWSPPEVGGVAGDDVRDDPGVVGTSVEGPGADVVPGAAQLELLRRLNRLGPLPHRVDHVLARPGPGRGPVHLRLPFSTAPAPVELVPSGPPAPPREVLRVAAGVLADLTAELPSAAPAPRRLRDRLRNRAGDRPVRPVSAGGVATFVLEGPPLTVALVRAQLAAVGLVEHRPAASRRPGRRGAQPDPEVAVVLARPLGESLAEVWASRVQDGAARAWPRFVAQWQGRGTLPPSAALDRTVDYWAGRLGAGNVHLVTVEPGLRLTAPADELSSTVARLLGAPIEGAGPSALTGSGPSAPPGAGPVPMTPAMVDVLRRVNGVLPFVCDEADRPRRRTALVELMSQERGRPRPAGVPRRHRGWVDETSAALVGSLSRSGCTVHGELSGLATPTTGDDATRHVGDSEVLTAMIRMIHRVDAELVRRRPRRRGGR